MMVNEICEKKYNKPLSGCTCIGNHIKCCIK